MTSFRLLHGDCRDGLKTLDAESIDACVTDPPYGLGFMGKKWDRGVPGVEFWQEVLRVLKPGAHLLAFGGTRTYHRLTCAIEDAGFEVRDCVMWVYSTGFPKSLDVSKAIDKAAGAEREVIGRRIYADGTAAHGKESSVYAQDKWSQSKDSWNTNDTAPATDAAKQWDGWGTALKPAYEPIILARKPLIGTVAANVLAHGTGAINVDGCRVGYEHDTPDPATNPLYRKEHGYKNANASDTGSSSYSLKDGSGERNPHARGRWPANIVHDGSDEVVAGFPQTMSGIETQPRGTGGIWSDVSNTPCGPQYGDTGSAARFFYSAKVSPEERGDSTHPTMKPVDLMRWLVRLVTPPGGTVLDPFSGSGSTGVACMHEGLSYVGIEADAAYLDMSRRRIAGVLPLFVEESVNAD